ncbi:hypothetical protein V8F06_010349, partial [Rhypophila decipiens]
PKYTIATIISCPCDISHITKGGISFVTGTHIAVVGCWVSALGSLPAGGYWKEIAAGLIPLNAVFFVYGIVVLGYHWGRNDRSGAYVDFKILAIGLLLVLLGALVFGAFAILYGPNGHAAKPFDFLVMTTTTTTTDDDDDARRPGTPPLAAVAAATLAPPVASMPPLAATSAMSGALRAPAPGITHRLISGSSSFSCSPLSTSPFVTGSGGTAPFGMPRPGLWPQLWPRSRLKGWRWLRAS